MRSPTYLFHGKSYWNGEGIANSLMHMDLDGKKNANEMDDLEVPPILGNLHYWVKMKDNTGNLDTDWNVHFFYKPIIGVPHKKKTRSEWILMDVSYTLFLSWNLWVDIFRWIWHIVGEVVLTLLEWITLWLFNIAMEHGPFIDGLPIKKWGFSMAMLNNQMVKDTTLNW